MNKPGDLIFPGRFLDIWEAWLQRVRDTLFGHGSDLVDQLGRAGFTDNVARAEDCLRWAVGAGILKREKNTPTQEQRFFDVNGDTVRRGWVTSGYSPAGHVYAFNQEKS